MTVALPKVPRTPPRRPLTAQPDEFVNWGDPLVRVLRTTGDHVVPWNRLRTFGPLPGCRWDPQPDGPAAEHAPEGVGYQAADLMTCVAEVFQASRLVDTLTGSPHAVFWTPVRPLRLLDLTGTWALRSGAATALGAAPKSTTRAWVRAIRADLPEVDGLLASSTMTGGATVTLFTPATDAFPEAPDSTVPLAGALGLALLAPMVRRIGYGVI